MPQERRDTPDTLDCQDPQDLQVSQELKVPQGEAVDGQDPSELLLQEEVFPRVLAAQRVQPDRPDSRDRLDRQGGLDLEGIQVGPEELDPPAQLPSQETQDPRAEEVAGRDPSELLLQEGLSQRVRAAQRVQPGRPDSRDRLDRQGGVVLAVRRV